MEPKPAAGQRFGIEGAAHGRDPPAHAGQPEPRSRMRDSGRLGVVVADGDHELVVAELAVGSTVAPVAGFKALVKRFLDDAMDAPFIGRARTRA